MAEITHNFRLCEYYTNTNYISKLGYFYCQKICPYGNQTLIKDNENYITICNSKLLISKFDENINS